MDVYHIIQYVADLLIGGGVIYLLKIVSAQKTIIDSFKSQSETIGHTQSTLSKMYDPKEIDKVLKVKEQLIRSEYEEELAKYKEQYEELLNESNLFDTVIDESNDLHKEDKLKKINYMLSLINLSLIVGSFKYLEIGRGILHVYTYLYPLIQNYGDYPNPNSFNRRLCKTLSCSLI